jgi:uncharacterized protein
MANKSPIIQSPRHRCAWLLYVGLLLALPTLAQAGTSLWRVSKGNHTLLLGGTVHLLKPSDYPLPDEFEQAFREAQLLAFETDMGALAKPEVQAALAQRLIYQDGSRLTDHIKPATYKVLKKHLRTVAIPEASLLTMKPALVVIVLTLENIKKAGSGDTGVDQLFFKKAQSGGKPVAGLETLETQMNALAALGEGQEDALILSTLKELKQTGASVQRLTAAWRRGDLAEMEKTGITPMLAEFPASYQQLIAGRNRAWLEKLEGYLSTPERELVLVGALHLAGKEGLLALLQQKGYRVEQY